MAEFAWRKRGPVLLEHVLWPEWHYTLRPETLLPMPAMTPNTFSPAFGRCNIATYVSFIPAGQWRIVPAELPRFSELLPLEAEG